MKNFQAQSFDKISYKVQGNFNCSMVISLHNYESIQYLLIKNCNSLICLDVKNRTSSYSHQIICLEKIESHRVEYLGFQIISALHFTCVTLADIGVSLLVFFFRNINCIQYINNILQFKYVSNCYTNNYKDHVHNKCYFTCVEDKNAGFPDFFLRFCPLACKAAYMPVLDN